MNKKEENIIEITLIIAEWFDKHGEKTEKRIDEVKEDIIRWADGFEVLDLDPDRYEYDYLTDLRFYTLGKIAEEWFDWTLTDSDCCQYHKRTERNEHRMIQLSYADPDGKNCLVFYDDDVEIPEKEELEEVLHFYGETLESLRESYGPDVMWDVCAEYAFEESCCDYSNALTGPMSQERATERIFEIITDPNN